MKKGSLVELREDLNVFVFILNIITGTNALPAKGQVYVSKGLSRCSCGKHDRIELEEFEGRTWDARYFNELQAPTTAEELLSGTAKS